MNFLPKLSRLCAYLECWRPYSQLHGYATEDGSHLRCIAAQWYPCFLRYSTVWTRKNPPKHHEIFLTLFFLFPLAASAQSVTPNFTQGSMQSTTTTTVDIERTIETEVYGGDYSSWTGNNVTPSGDITNSSTTFSVTTAGDPFQLEVTTREPV